MERPVANDSQALTVQFSFTLMQVMDVVCMAHQCSVTITYLICTQRKSSQVKSSLFKNNTHISTSAFKESLVAVIVPPPTGYAKIPATAGHIIFYQRELVTSQLKLD